MSYYDYKTSLELSIKDPPFAALIMAAMRKADTSNTEMLKACWPEIYHELERRYHAPGGLIDKECWTRKRKGEITLTWLVEPDASQCAEFDDGHDD
jgi:hypothetical protein